MVQKSRAAHQEEVQLHLSTQYVIKTCYKLFSFLLFHDRRIVKKRQHFWGTLQVCDIFQISSVQPRTLVIEVELLVIHQDYRNNKRISVIMPGSPHDISVSDEAVVRAADVAVTELKNRAVILGALDEDSTIVRGDIVKAMQQVSFNSSQTVSSDIFKMYQCALQP